MLESKFILKADVSAAILNAIRAVRPLLLAAESSAKAYGDEAALADLRDLHAELARQLKLADNMLETGTIHADSGGTDKGDAQ